MGILSNEHVSEYTIVLSNVRDDMPNNRNEILCMNILAQHNSLLE
jgi:hypothetical protein